MNTTNIAQELKTFKTAQLAFAKATQEYNKTVQDLTAKINKLRLKIDQKIKVKAPAAKRAKAKRTLPPTPTRDDGSYLENGCTVGGERRMWG